MEPLDKEVGWTLIDVAPLMNKYIVIQDNIPSVRGIGKVIKIESSSLNERPRIVLLAPPSILTAGMYLERAFTISILEGV